MRCAVLEDYLSIEIKCFKLCLRGLILLKLDDLYIYFADWLTHNMTPVAHSVPPPTAHPQFENFDFQFPRRKSSEDNGIPQRKASIRYALRSSVRRASTQPSSPAPEAINEINDNSEANSPNPIVPRAKISWRQSFSISRGCQNVKGKQSLAGRKKSGVVPPFHFNEDGIAEWDEVTSSPPSCSTRSNSNAQSVEPEDPDDNDWQIEWFDNEADARQRTEQILKSRGRQESFHWLHSNGRQSPRPDEEAPEPEQQPLKPPSRQDSQSQEECNEEDPESTDSSVDPTSKLGLMHRIGLKTGWKKSPGRSNSLPQNGISHRVAQRLRAVSTSNQRSAAPVIRRSLSGRLSFIIPFRRTTSAPIDSAGDDDDGGDCPAFDERRPGDF